MKLKRYIYVNNSAHGDGHYRRLHIGRIIIILCVMAVIGAGGAFYFGGNRKPVLIKKLDLKQYQEENAELEAILADLRGEKDSVEAVFNKLIETEETLALLVPNGDTAEVESTVNSDELSLALLQSYSDTLVVFLKSVARSSDKKEKIWRKLPVIAPVADSAYVISRKFGKGVDPFTGLEKNFPSVAFSAVAGTAVRSTADGVVEKSFWDKLNGNRVEISHGNGISTVYNHLEALSIPVGRRVKKGQRIGAVGESGWSVGPMVAYELHKNGKAVDPLPFIMAGEE